MNIKNRSRNPDAHPTTSPVVLRSPEIWGIDGTNVLDVKTGYHHQLVDVLYPKTISHMQRVHPILQ
jgi:hypothetical protein